MDLLIVEPLEAEVLQWLQARYSVRVAPELAHDPREFRTALHNVRALILPSTLAVTSQTLRHAPQLRAVGRVSGGAENIDVDACGRFGVEVVRSLTATAQAEAEFALSAMLSLLRRVPVASPDGMWVGRELGAATVGLIGMPPAAKSMAGMLAGFGSKLVGYDPSLHASDSLWGRWKVQPLGLRELLETADAVCVQLNYFSRYQGLLGDRLLPYCKQDQVLVSLTHSGIFDLAVLARVLKSGQLAAAWLDSLEPGAQDEGRPLHGVANLQVTPRVASTTRESRLRSAWSVARRIDDLLALSAASQAEFRPTAPGDPADLADAPKSP
jgi:phosphoglycerate dehydrogenase-like enzyme